MKELLYLCTKNVHFSFDNNIYIHNDGVAMGLTLGPILANIFMVELERSVIPSLANKLNSWRRYDLLYKNGLHRLCPFETK